MVFRKHQRKIMGRFGRKEMKCSECGTVIEYGDVYYSRIIKRRRDNTVRHLARMHAHRSIVNYSRRKNNYERECEPLQTLLMVCERVPFIDF